MNLLSLLRKVPALAAITVGALGLGAVAAAAGPYVQTDLVSNIPGLAELTDSALVNPWGVSNSATSPLWISNQGTNTATLYAITNSIQVSKVTSVFPPTGNIPIPTTGSGPQGPTGQVNNNTTAFPVGNGGDNQPAHFIFANLNGTISAWDKAGSPAVTQATTPGALYTGLAIASVSGTPYVYAADGGATSGIRIFNGSWADVTNTTFAGKFVDPNIPVGYVPFNVQNLGGQIYVTYAPATKGPDRTPQTMAPAGQGFVDVYDTSGNLVRRLITGSQLAAPWGITFAPANFGKFSNDLLVGNFSYILSEINAFDPTNGTFLGTIPIDTGGNPPGGLWALYFGSGAPGGMNGSANTLYFTDGIGFDGVPMSNEMYGLFGAINVPEPSGLALLASALVLFGFSRARSHRRG